MVCSNCDTVEHFTSVPLEWRCDACDSMNGYSNKGLVNRTSLEEIYTAAADTSKSDKLRKELAELKAKANDAGFKKLDSGKTRFTLVDPVFVEGFAKILTDGAQKYGVDNWKLLPDDELHRYQDALLRHINSYFKGEKLDPETGMSHLYHAACNLMFLDYFDRTR